MTHPRPSWNSVIREDFVFPLVSEGTPSEEAVRLVTYALEQHLLTSDTVRAHIAATTKDVGIDCPDSPLEELVRYVADQKGQIDMSDPVLMLRFLQKYVAPVFRLERTLVRAALEATRGLTTDESMLFYASMDLAEATDDLWAAWFQRIVIPYQSLGADERSHYNEIVSRVLAPYDYTVFNYDPKHGCVDRLPWAIAFPQEIATLCAVLEGFKDSALPGIAAYGAALANAYACIDVEKLEQMWTAVDRAWIRIPSTARLIPVHGMESGYEHPFGVSPEFRLEVRTPHHRELIGGHKEGTLEHARAFGLSSDLVRQAEERLNRIDISVFTTALRAGVSLSFRYAGQAVPNRQDVLAEGGRIFVDQSAAPRTAGRYAEALGKHCTPDTARRFSPFLTAEAQIAATASHEYAHPVGRTAESDSILGRSGMNLCEEAKATLLGILGSEHRDASPDHRRVLVANMVGRILRFMHTSLLESKTFAPYVRENLAATKTLFESGVISLSEKGLAIDYVRAGEAAWFDALRMFVRDVLTAYENRDNAALERLANQYCSREHTETKKLIAWVNRT